MIFKIYYTYTETEAVKVEAKTPNEAEEKFWNDDYIEGSKETVMGSEANVTVEEIHDDKGNYIYSKDFEKDFDKEVSNIKGN